MMKAFEYIRPTSIAEACRLCCDPDEKAKFLAGGTDLLIRMKRKVMHPTRLVSLRDVPGLSTIDFSPDKGLTIDAMVLLSDIENSQIIDRNYPSVVTSAGTIGSVQIRNRATLGGNICNAAPSADMLPILIAYGATAVITDGKSERSVSLADFFVGPGKTVLENGEILKTITVPAPPPSSFGQYLKSYRSALDLSVVGVGAVVAFEPGQSQCRQLKLVLGAVGPTPIRARRAEDLAAGQTLDNTLIEKIGRMAAEEAAPISDIRATASYRKTLVEVNTRRVLIAARTWAQKGGTA
jgi:aerobic carbon-monoxide dehydrogenase medium subunit